MSVQVSEQSSETDNTARLEINGIQVPESVVVIPPPEVRDIIERTVGYIVRSGTAFIQRLQNKKDAKFSFLFDDDPYNSYYQWRLNENRNGRSMSTGGMETKVESVKKTGIKEPEKLEFSHDLPPITGQDLEIIKTTALYASIKGKQFITALMHQEGNNFQFDFLKKNHSLHPLFNSLTEEYKKILHFTPKTSSSLKERIDTGLRDKYDVLKRARLRAEWLAYKQEQEEKDAAEQEKERIEYAQIDWHDFVVVETVQYSEADLDLQLPTPLTLSDLQFASLEEKKKGIFRIEEAPPDYEPEEHAPEKPKDVKSNGISSKPTSISPPISAVSGAPGKIRSAGTSRLSKLRQQSEKMIRSPFTGQMIPESKFEDHKKAMLLDPKWKEQRATEEARASTTNLSTVDVEQNLKRILKRDNDGEQDQQEEERKKRAKESQWDGRYSTREEAARRAKQSFKEQRKEYQKAVDKEKQIGPH